MTKFNVTVRQDAWIFHNATIEADSAEQAAEKALRAWKHGDETVVFTEDGYEGFDHADCEAEDCVEQETADA